MTLMHKETAKQRWYQLSLAEQMGNIGSEVDRAIAWIEKNNKAYAENALYRALELLDLTIADKRWGTGKKELTRAREIICDMFLGDNEYNITFDWLKQYFLQFALLAAREK